MSFADASSGWAVGANGTVLASTDGGVTWRSLPSGTAFDLRAVQFTDARNGWVAGAHGTLLATSDAGTTWRAIDTGGVSPFLAMTAADPSHLWASAADGTVLSASTPDTGPIVTAEHPAELRAALRSAGGDEAEVNRPLREFSAADSDLTEATAQLERDRAAAIPGMAAESLSATPPDNTSAEPSRLTSMLYDPSLLIFANRAIITTFSLLAALILAVVIRRASRLSVHIDACTDALILCGGVADDRFFALARTLSPLDVRAFDRSDATSMISLKQRGEGQWVR